ncbi:luciferase family protein [Enhygromyxa salina]|uniref:Luciferase-like monooxygenase n=1 Tax=Enhygromyxa salina TaxID=215803 RepID=A0A0C2DIM5_9BACT|nr:luciferase family protein [Enhygromyxa salina]
MPLSVLDLAFVAEGETVQDSLAGCVRMAQRAEQLGYRRVWYAEHHNTESIASSAPAVLIAHVAAHTKHIRLGAGGVMLPNHAPLVVAEQFGTLASIHPNRIDLGLGRAPGTDQNTLRALRRSAAAAESFPQDVLEVQGFLGGTTRIPHVHAVPGRGTTVPLYILGSSLFGAQLAARLGLPYAFASHFAPQQLVEAVATYRAQFEPSKQLDRPHVIAGINVIATDTQAAAEEQMRWRRRAFARALFGRPGHRPNDSEVDVMLASPQARVLDQMLIHTAMGPPAAVKAAIDQFTTYANADELMVVHQAATLDARLRSLELLAQAHF